MCNNQSVKFLLVFLGLILLATSCSQRSSDKKVVDPKTEKLKLPPGFHAEHLYSPGENEQGSWVAMTFDDKGRMIACDQYGFLYRITIPPVGSDTAASKINVEKLAIKIAGDTALRSYMVQQAIVNYEKVLENLSKMQSEIKN